MAKVVHTTSTLPYKARWAGSTPSQPAQERLGSYSAMGLVLSGSVRAGERAIIRRLSRILALISMIDPPARGHGACDEFEKASKEVTG